MESVTVPSYVISTAGRNLSVINFKIPRSDKSELGMTSILMRRKLFVELHKSGPTKLAEECGRYQVFIHSGGRIRPLVTSAILIPLMNSQISSPL